MKDMIGVHSPPGKNHSTPRKRMKMRALTLKKDWRYIRRVWKMMQQGALLPWYSGEGFHWQNPHGYPFGGAAAGVACFQIRNGGMSHIGSIMPAISPYF